MLKYKSFNLNVTEVLVSDFKNAFPGIFNFTVGVLIGAKNNERVSREVHFKFEFIFDKNENFEFIVGFFCRCKSTFWPRIVQFWTFRVRTGIPGLSVYRDSGITIRSVEHWIRINRYKSTKQWKFHYGTAYNSNFGINYVDCASSYFRPGAYWPLQSAANAGTTVRLCNNVFGKQHWKNLK